MGCTWPDKFASGEGIQDALVPARRHAVPERRDGRRCCVRSTLKDEPARVDHPNILLTLYTSANSVFPMRVKAGKESPASSTSRCLVLYGYGHAAVLL
jgi:hypothetical protein